MDSRARGEGEGSERDGVGERRNREGRGEGKEKENGAGGSTVEDHGCRGVRQLRLASSGPELIGNTIPQLLLETLGSLWLRPANSPAVGPTSGLYRSAPPASF